MTKLSATTAAGHHTTAIILTAKELPISHHVSKISSNSRSASMVTEQNTWLCSYV